MTIRNFYGVPHVLKSDTLLTEFGKNYRDTFWIECDENGKVKDVNGDGEISYKQLLCHLKEGQETIDLNTLKEDCLYENNNGQLVYEE